MHIQPCDMSALGVSSEDSIQGAYQMLSQEGALTAGFQDMKVSVEMPLAAAIA
jgi:hypothetical protein